MCMLKMTAFKTISTLSTFSKNLENRKIIGHTKERVIFQRIVLIQKPITILKLSFYHIICYQKLVM